MRLFHGRSWHWRALRSHAFVRCARCGLPIERRASASPSYGGVDPAGPTVTARMSEGTCSCVHPEPVVADAAGVATG